jgi:hypothetical protein
VSLAIPLAAQIAKYPSPRVVARGRDLREPQKKAGRSKGGRDRAPESQDDELREKATQNVFLRLSTLPWVGNCSVVPTSGVLWQGLHAHEWKPHTAYAVEDSV